MTVKISCLRCLCCIALRSVPFSSGPFSISLVRCVRLGVIVFGKYTNLFHAIPLLLSQHSSKLANAVCSRIKSFFTIRSVCASFFYVSYTHSLVLYLSIASSERPWKMCLVLVWVCQRWKMPLRRTVHHVYCIVSVSPCSLCVRAHSVDLPLHLSPSFLLLWHSLASSQHHMCVHK